MTTQEAIDIQTLIRALFIIPEEWRAWDQPGEQAVREAAERLRERAFGKLHAGISAEQLEAAPLRSIL